jgi:hypothetical protein
VALSGALIAAGNLWHVNDGTVANQNDCSATVSPHATLSLVVVILGLDTMFNRISYPPSGRVCGEGHPLLLIRGYPPAPSITCARSRLMIRVPSRTGTNCVLQLRRCDWPIIVILPRGRPLGDAGYLGRQGKTPLPLDLRVALTSGKVLCIDRWSPPRVTNGHSSTLPKIRRKFIGEIVQLQTNAGAAEVDAHFASPRCREAADRRSLSPLAGHTERIADNSN